MGLASVTPGLEAVGLSRSFFDTSCLDLVLEVKGTPATSGLTGP